MQTSPKSNGLFPTILASTVHDIKNSLGTLLELVRQAAARQDGQSAELNQLEFEAARINHSLMQLLVMYKVDSQKFSLDIEESAVTDIVNEAIHQQARLAGLHNIDLQVDCNADLLCYCDSPIISNALAAVLNNALRYTRNTVLISVAEEDGYVHIAIEDDGDGYPPHFLAADLNDTAELDWVSGNTGLGLYFVSVMAGLHKNAGKSGFVRIDNESCLGGARFKLFLP
ncbi:MULTISPECIES: sensor histidine kinase [Methylomonas]|uniref:Histidine kinase n=2 Tax=Methylomonas TaxID=416 RepID=A0A140E3Z6_9GAMM|nr:MULTISPECIES: HAMP domain-containing sensor histidine kinase [Methylomonas]AMK75120.1 histidine kinase [Methylomonas denitrificans]OAI02610.1 histidine kinase [Methylomonas methanica]TCV83064.1 signal transduction histidine kinase [Methylomonas methanica]